MKNGIRDRQTSVTNPIVIEHELSNMSIHHNDDTGQDIRNISEASASLQHREVKMLRKDERIF